MAKTKYEQLVEEKKHWIEDIKQLRKREKELRQEAAKYHQRAQALYFTERNRERMGELYNKAQALENQRAEVQENLDELEYMLDEMLQMAYEDCPFPSIRRKGIAGFYRAAGL